MYPIKSFYIEGRRVYALMERALCPYSPLLKCPNKTLRVAILAEEDEEVEELDPVEEEEGVALVNVSAVGCGRCQSLCLKH